VYLDPDVLTATKVLAASGDRSESQIVEEALRAYLGNGALEAAGDGLRQLMNRIAEHDSLDDESAMNLAVEEVRATRANSDMAKSA
jgi:hypothetical protein